MKSIIILIFYYKLTGSVRYSQVPAKIQNHHLDPPWPVGKSDPDPQVHDLQVFFGRYLGPTCEWSALVTIPTVGARDRARALSMVVFCTLRGDLALQTGISWPKRWYEPLFGPFFGLWVGCDTGHTVPVTCNTMPVTVYLCTGAG